MHIEVKSDDPTSSPYQKEIIEAVVEGHDVYVQAATSFGKSLCFQLPAVIGTGGEYAIVDIQFESLKFSSYCCNFTAPESDGKWRKCYDGDNE